MSFEKNGLAGGLANKKAENQSEIEKAVYDAEVLKRDGFLKAQKGVETEGTKNFANYEEFKKNPSESLIELYKKDLDKDYDLMKEELAKGKDADTETVSMYSRNIEALNQKIAIFYKHGSENQNKHELEVADKSQLEAEKNIYDAEVLKRDSFLKAQKGVETEGTKNFANYEEFKKNPSESLIELYKKDLDKDYELMREELAKGKDADMDIVSMHSRNMEALNKKISIFYKYGNEPKSISDLVGDFIQKKSQDKADQIAQAESSEAVKDSVMDFIQKKSQDKADQIAQAESSEAIKDSVMDFMQKSSKNKINKMAQAEGVGVNEGADDAVEELSEPEFDLELSSEDRQGLSGEEFGEQPEESDEQPEELDEQPEGEFEEPREKRGRIFEFIRKHPKLKWAAAAVGIIAIGLGVFKSAEGASKDGKEINKKEIVKPGMEPDAPEIPVINIADEIIKDGLTKKGIDVSKLNPDVLDTILEEVGFISGAEVLDAGDGIGVITKTAENGFKNDMPGKTLVNLIDSETGAIYRGLEASSILVHPGDIVLKNSDGEYFVIANKAGLNFKKVEKATPADAKIVSKTTDVAGADKQSVEQSGTAKSTETVKPGQPKVETAPAQAKADTAGVVQNKAGVNLDNPIDLSEMVRNNKAEVKTASQGEDKSADKTVSTEPKVKKSFWKRVFGGRDKK